jgi:hypothetical protein
VTSSVYRGSLLTRMRRLLQGRLASLLVLPVSAKLTSIRQLTAGQLVCIRSDVTEGYMLNHLQGLRFPLSTIPSSPTKEFILHLKAHFMYHLPMVLVLMMALQVCEDI